MTQATPPPRTGALEAAVLHDYTSQAAAANPSAGGMLLGSGGARRLAYINTRQTAAWGAQAGAMR